MALFIVSMGYLVRGTTFGFGNLLEYETKFKTFLGTNLRAHEGRGEKPRVETKTLLILSLYADFATAWLAPPPRYTHIFMSKL